MAFVFTILIIIGDFTEKYPEHLTQVLTPVLHLQLPLLRS